MSLTYSTTVSSLAVLMAEDPTNVDFLAMVPNAIAYAEGRIYRELNMIVGNIRDATGVTSSTTRNFNLPTGIGTFLIIDGINIITPAGTAADSGTRHQLTPVSRDVLDMVWPSSTGATVPSMFAYISQNTYLAGPAAQTQVIFGPWPDAAYTVEVIGKIQPAAMTAINPNTFLGDNLSDLYLAACMIYMCGFQKNYSATSDDPRSAVSWEGQYVALRDSSATWEARKRFSGASWTSKMVEPTAVNQRG